MTNLGVLELLFNVFDEGLTVEADKGACHKLRVNWVSTNHLASDLQQCPDLRCGHLTHPGGKIMFNFYHFSQSFNKTHPIGNASLRARQILPVKSSLLTGTFLWIASLPN